MEKINLKANGLEVEEYTRDTVAEAHQQKTGNALPGLMSHN